MTLMYSPLRPVGRGWLQAMRSQYPRVAMRFDGIDQGAVVAQQDMAHALLVEGGQVELGSSLGCPGGGFTHDGFISVFG